jgi:hypothetical protein
MDEIQAMKRVLRILDSSVHVHAARRAGVALNGRVGIDNLELVGVLGDTKLVARHDGDLREQSACGFPAFGASAHVVMSGLRRDAYLDGIASAFAMKRTAREARGAGLHAIIYRRMN